MPSLLSFRGSGATVGISRYNVNRRKGDRNIVAGDCHGLAASQ